MLSCVTSDLECVPFRGKAAVICSPESPLDSMSTCKSCLRTVSANERREWFVWITCGKSWLRVSRAQPPPSGHISNMWPSRAGLIIRRMFPSWFNVLMLYSCSVSREAHRSTALQIQIHLKCSHQLLKPTFTWLQIKAFLIITCSQ